MTDSALVEAVAGCLEAAGVAQWGVAACPHEPWPYAPALPRAVSLGVALAPEVIGPVQDGPTAAYFAEYRRVNVALWEAAQSLAAVLRAHGATAEPLRPTIGPTVGDKQAVDMTAAGVFAHKTAATQAGPRLDRQDGHLRLSPSGPLASPDNGVHRRRAAGGRAGHAGRLRQVPALRGRLPRRRRPRRPVARRHAAAGAPRRRGMHDRERPPRRRRAACAASACPCAPSGASCCAPDRACLRLSAPERPCPRLTRALLRRLTAPATRALSARLVMLDFALQREVPLRHKVNAAWSTT